MLRSLRLAAIALVVTSPLGAENLPEESYNRWAICANGVTYTTCAEFELRTWAWMHEGARYGTYAAIVVRNLQGATNHDTSPASFLVNFGFSGPMPTGGADNTNWYYGAPFVAVGGAPAMGPANIWRIFDVASNGLESPMMRYWGWPWTLGDDALIAGCDDIPWRSAEQNAVQPRTCGREQGYSAQMTRVPGTFDAKNFGNAWAMWTVGEWSTQGCNAYGNGVNPCLDITNAAAVPEPATIALVATGLAGVGALRRRRRPHVCR